MAKLLVCPVVHLLNVMESFLSASALNPSCRGLHHDVMYGFAGVGCLRRLEHAARGSQLVEWVLASIFWQPT